MHFGQAYCEKHTRIYAHLYELLKNNGIMLINVSNFIRKGVEVNVCEWTKETIIDLGFKFVCERKISTPRMGYGANRSARVSTESILVFKKEV